MDAATPFRRWLRPAGFAALLAAGCQTTPPAAPVTRGQLPADPPAAPLAPLAPGPVAPVAPAAVTGQPVSTAAGVPVAGQPVPAGYSPAAATAPEKPARNGTPRIKVVAVIGAGNIVTDEEVWESVRQRSGEYVTLVDGPGGKQVVRDDAREKALYTEELRRIVERELILDEMYARLKKVGKAQVIDEIKDFAGKAADRQIREFKKNTRAHSDEEFALILGTQGLTQPVIRRQLERQMMAEEYVRSTLKERGKAVGLSEVRTYYDAHPDEFRTTDRVKWQDIFISFNRFPNPRAAYDHALTVQAAAAAPGADFAALSKAHDQGLAGQQGGEGIGEVRGEIQPPDVEPAVWALAAGQVSGLVETPAGYHVIKVVERQTAGVRPFDEKTQADVKRKLTRLLQEREYKRLVEDLWRRGVVRVMEQ
jgi:hypothetical protein